MTTPIPLARGWLPAAPSTLDPLRKYWLFRPGALTAGLRQLGHVRLRVLAEYPTGAPRDEADGMRIAAQSPVWVREVLMSIDGVDSVVARSPGIHRSVFVCRRLAAGVPFHATAIARAPAG
ncbi:chorismate--pyruvate lyase family protein, partial [Bordetella pertussis]|uniref:chorismate--pyruvate lyase family protein n=1 Tax=Bordetella pertussis TaxID=520 RepID=UPI000AE28C84